MIPCDAISSDVDILMIYKSMAMLTKRDNFEEMSNASCYDALNTSINVDENLMKIS